MAGTLTGAMDGVVLRLRTADGREVRPRVRTARALGRLAPPVGGGAVEHHVRCGCGRCGAHLLGSRSLAGEVTGVCLVCGSDEIDAL